MNHSVIAPGPRSRKSRLLLVGLCLVACIAAAATLGWRLSQTDENVPDDKVTAEIERVIRRYNDLLTEGYRSLDMTNMGEVASQLQAEDEYIHMSSLAEGGVRLDPELTDLEFIRISAEATSAQVETRETWDYRHYSRATGELVFEQSGLVYHLAWDLLKVPNGTWLVADVRAISATSTAEPNVPQTTTPSTPAQ